MGNELALSPFANLQGGQPAEQMVSGKTNNYCLAIVGRQKSGKSWFATSDNQKIIYDPATKAISKVPKYTWVGDFDNRSESLAGRPNVYVRTFVDLSQQSPNAIMDLENQLASFKYDKERGKPIPDVFVLDSITYMKKALENEIMRQSTVAKGNNNMFREVGTSAKKVRIPQGWDMINAVRGYLEYFIADFRTLGNLICVFHERPEKDQVHSTKDNTVFTGQYSVDPFYLNTLLSVFSEVMRISVDGYGKYIVTTQTNNEFNAATTWKVDQDEQPSISGMLEKHFNHIAKGTQPLRK